MMHFLEFFLLHTTKLHLETEIEYSINTVILSCDQLTDISH